MHVTRMKKSVKSYTLCERDSLEDTCVDGTVM